MKYPHFTTATRGFIRRVLRAPRTSVLVAGALIMLAIGVALGMSLVGAQPANAGGTCQANGGYSLPSTLSLTSATNGLTVQDDPVSNYGVGGATEGAIRDALNTCAPSFMGANKSGEFLAYTSYTVGWQYDTQMLTDGTCRLTNVKVGLHLSQLEPSLLNESTTNSAIQAKWSSFISGLKTHEDGHKAVDVTQAQDLLAALQNLHTSCSTINSAINATTNAALQNLITANADHDTDTNYGRDQGAIW